MLEFYVQVEQSIFKIIMILNNLVFCMLINFAAFYHRIEAHSNSHVDSKQGMHAFKQLKLTFFANI